MFLFFVQSSDCSITDAGLGSSKLVPILIKAGFPDIKRFLAGSWSKLSIHPRSTRANQSDFSYKKMGKLR